MSRQSDADLAAEARKQAMAWAGEVASEFDQIFSGMLPIGTTEEDCRTYRRRAWDAVLDDTKGTLTALARDPRRRRLLALILKAITGSEYVQ